MVGASLTVAQSCEYVLGVDELPMYTKGYEAKSEKYIAQINARLSENLNQVDSKYKKDYKEVYEFSSKYLIDLFKSEFFLFGDTINDIVDHIGSRLLKANNIRRADEVQFFVSRTGVPNAFTMNNGIIVINLGLLSRLNHLDELAFVMSHELAHYHLNHIEKAIDKKIKLLNSEELKN